MAIRVAPSMRRRNRLLPLPVRSLITFRRRRRRRQIVLQIMDISKMPRAHQPTDDAYPPSYFCLLCRHCVLPLEWQMSTRNSPMISYRHLPPSIRKVSMDNHNITINPHWSSNLHDYYRGIGKSKCCTRMGDCARSCCSTYRKSEDEGEGRARRECLVQKVICGSCGSATEGMS